MSHTPNPILPPAAWPTITPTEHAMLVVWGLFARQIGLIEKLQALSLPQRTRDHTPQTKLIQFLVAILGGGEYLQDMSKGPHPLVKDHAVAEAWAQPGWADYSGVSRTLKACTAENVNDFVAVLNAVSQPFIDREVTVSMRDTGTLVWDGDLTCRSVSNTSTTYAGAKFGWMSDEVGLGFQAAVVTLRSPTYGRLILSGEHHPGDVVSVTQAEALVRAAEVRTGVRPHRRTELLAERITQQQQTLPPLESKLQQRQTTVSRATEQLAQVEQQHHAWQAKVAAWETKYAARQRPERPHSRLAQAHQKLTVYTERLQRRQHTLENAQRRVTRAQAKLQAAKVELEQLLTRHRQLLHDNASNPAPVQVIIRLDAGFGSGPNVALLIELGYEVYCKAHNAQVSTALRKRVSPDTAWTRVGANAEMIGWAHHRVRNCPYPLEVGLERFHTGNALRHSTLLHFGPTPVTDDLPGWFQFYNGRQLIEASNKEGKSVFQIKHLKVRSASGLVIQEHCTFFVANLVRWAAEWLSNSAPELPAPFNQPQVSVKQMVRVAANTSAWVISEPPGTLLRFAESSPFAGLELNLVAGWEFQPPLALLKSCEISD
jgi:hypothetical protein